MAVLRFIIPALAIAGHVAADSSSSCSISATTTLSSASDATALALSCQTFTGNIAIATGTTDAIALDGLVELNGDLSANGATKLATLSGQNLRSISGAFNLTSLTVLSTLNFPMLTSVGVVNWQTLNMLQGLSLQSGLQMVKSLTISDTQLTNLNGINLVEADTIEINNNAYLKTVNMHLVNVTSSLDISSNGGPTEVDFPNLVLANNFVVRNASSVSIPSLSSVSGTFGLYENSFSSIAGPNLTNAGSFAIDQNNQLTNASFPVLTTVNGAFDLGNNSALTNISGFGALQHVQGAVDITGNIKNITLPALKTVVGGFNLQSTNDITVACNTFKPLSGSGQPIQGPYTCAGDQSTTGGLGTKPSGYSNGGSGTSSATSQTSTGAAHPILIPGATGLLGVMAAIFGML